MISGPTTMVHDFSGKPSPSIEGVDPATSQALVETIDGPLMDDATSPDDPEEVVRLVSNIVISELDQLLAKKNTVLNDKQRHEVFTQVIGPLLKRYQGFVRSAAKNVLDPQQVHVHQEVLHNIAEGRIDDYLKQHSMPDAA